MAVRGPSGPIDLAALLAATLAALLPGIVKGEPWNGQPCLRRSLKTTYIVEFGTR